MGIPPKANKPGKPLGMGNRGVQNVSNMDSHLALWVFPLFSTIINSNKKNQTPSLSGTPSAGNPFSDPKIQRILRIYIGNKFPRVNVMSKEGKRNFLSFYVNYISL